MNEQIKRSIKILTSNPKTVFLIDGSGALLTAILLMAVVWTFSDYFGMPKKVLPMLSITALAFSIYSFYCALFLRNNWQKFLRPIVAANLSYCILTLGLVIYFFSRLTILGVAYFLGEILIICGLVFVEVKTIKQVGKYLP